MHDKSNDNADSALWLKVRQSAEEMMKAGISPADARDALADIIRTGLGAHESGSATRLPAQNLTTDNLHSSRRRSRPT